MRRNPSAAVWLEHWLSPLTQSSAKQNVPARMELLFQEQGSFRGTTDFTLGIVIERGGQP